jgi:hypothetical protein
MTEQNWLNFAGFLNNCNYGLDNKNCPFLKYQKLDQFQKLEYLLNIDEKEASKMIECCGKHRNDCKKPEKKRSSNIISPESIPLSQNIEISLSI